MRQGEQEQEIPEAPRRGSSCQELLELEATNASHHAKGCHRSLLRNPTGFIQPRC